MSIRPAEEKDIAGITKLLYQVNQIHADGRPDLFKSGGIKYTQDELKSIILDKTRPVFVCVDDDKVLGYAFIWYEMTKESASTYPVKSMYIDDLCVDENVRGKSVGKKLFEFLKEEARKELCDRITLHVWECNPNAYDFYEHLGMKPLYTNMEYQID